MEENNLSKKTTKTDGDFPWIFVIVFVLVSIFAKFLIDNYQMEIFFLFQFIIAADLFVFTFIIYYLSQQEVRLLYKEIFWTVGLLFLLVGSILIAYFSTFQNRYISPAERDLLGSYSIPLLQFFGLIILFFMILYILIMLIMTAYVYKNTLQDDHLSGWILNHWNSRFWILGILFICLISSMIYGIGLFGKPPESETLQIFGEMFR